MLGVGGWNCERERERERDRREDEGWMDEKRKRRYMIFGIGAWG